MWKVLTNTSTLALFIRKFRIFSYAQDIDLTGDVAPFPAPTTRDTAGLPFSCHKSEHCEYKTNCKEKLVSFISWLIVHLDVCEHF